MKLFFLNTSKTLTIIVFQLMLITCKKFPEDGKISWHTVSKRLTDHKWVLKESYVDDQDSTYNIYSHHYNSLNFNAFWNVYNSELSFQKLKLIPDKDGDLIGTFNIVNVSSDNASYVPSIAGPFTWSVHHENISIKISDYNKKSDDFNFPLLDQINDNDTWEIRKLTDKEFIIETKNYSGKKIRIKFYPS